jgi:hypothetical protein
MDPIGQAPKSRIGQLLRSNLFVKIAEIGLVFLAALVLIKIRIHFRIHHHG